MEENAKDTKAGISVVPEDFMTEMGLDEEPVGVFYTDRKPESGVSPEPQKPISREAEEKDEVDWGDVMGKFSCVVAKIRQARMKKTAAFFDEERFGCLGGAFYLGFLKPYLNVHPYYISSGIPGMVDGERYVRTHEVAQKFFDIFDPPPAPARYLVVKPLSLLAADETPEIVVFFGRPEVVSGLNGLTAFVTGEIESVRTPFGPGCSGFVTWPLKFLKEGKQVAVLGGFDPSCRKYLKNDELTFAVPLAMYEQMLEQWQESFLKESAWSEVKKKIARSRKKWKT
ncbi:MAG: DUF169 domain-containing protein [Proteobacteria bacterium]|nr:DUF169 domain-containing protein [Pseudomonadota bacterium]